MVIRPAPAWPAFDCGVRPRCRLTSCRAWSAVAVSWYSRAVPHAPAAIYFYFGPCHLNLRPLDATNPQTTSQRDTMAHHLQLIAFASLMAAQAFAAGYSYLCGWHRPDRDQARAPRADAPLPVLATGKSRARAA
jgi:hypothetical protein